MFLFPEFYAWNTFETRKWNQILIFLNNFEILVFKKINLNYNNSLFHLELLSLIIVFKILFYAEIFKEIFYSKFISQRHSTEIRIVTKTMNIH